MGESHFAARYWSLPSDWTMQETVKQWDELTKIEYWIFVNSYDTFFGSRPSPQTFSLRKDRMFQALGAQRVSLSYLCSQPRISNFSRP